MGWKMNTPYDDYDRPSGCRNCEEIDKKFDHAREYLNAIVKLLYIDQKIDCAKLEDNLEMLCNYLEVNTPVGLINICRSDTKIKKFENPFNYEDLIETNQQYLKLLRN